MQRPLTEVVVSAAGPSKPGQGLGTVTLYDLNTGSCLFTLKQTLAGLHSTVATETRNGQGGLILAAQLDKNLLNVYSYQKDQLHLRIVLPEKLTCIAVDNQSMYCAGGTQGGRVYLWEIASGILFNSWEAHYRRIGVMKFTQDGGALVTGSDDSTVSVWSMASLLDNVISLEIPSAYYTLSDHSLPITDIVCGVGPFPRCRVLTSSADHSCKLSDLASRSIISTFQFPNPITSLAMDTTERVFFAASPDGHIHQVNLFRKRIDKFGQRVEAVGGGGQGSAEMIAFEEAEKKRLISVGDTINSMVISLTSSHLVVGTSSARILIYDIASHQLIRTINTPKELAVNSVQVMLKPQDLMGHTTIGTAKNDANMPIRSVASFQRTRDPKARDVHDILLLLPPNNKRPIPVAAGPSPEDFLDDYRFFTDPAIINADSTSNSSSSAAVLAGPAATARITALEREVAALRSQLSRAKDLNTSLYESALTAVLGDKLSLSSSGSSVHATKERPTPNAKINAVADGRATKRGRFE